MALSPWIVSDARFILDLPAGTTLEDYNTVLVWCETFGEFITATKYR